MIRIVDFRKAVLAGVVAAIAWELVLRALKLAGIPLFDLVHALGTLAFVDEQMSGWWTVGMAAHAAVGSLWAIFYAYAFWSWFDWRPVVQGLVFSLLPAVLAFVFILPQLDLMHSAQSIGRIDFLDFFGSLGWREPAGLLLGHLIFGAVLGAMYTHPVGYRSDRPPSAITAHRPTIGGDAPGQAPHRGFIFATGIECSYPTIEGGRWRRDQMSATDHYRRWREDFSIARDIGVTHLRYGPPLHLIVQEAGRYDWDFVDAAMAELHEHGPEPIIDLCHFGLPTWLGNFQNPAATNVRAEYAKAFAARYSWVRFYTPVNEMYVCSRLSALDGLWNEQRHDEKSFVTAVRHTAKASALMTDAILGLQPNAIFINCESSEFFQPCCPDPDVQRTAEFENERRFLPLDLIYAHPVGKSTRNFLRDNGMVDDEYDWFMNREVPQNSALGVDYYERNEKLIDKNGRPQALGELFGWYVIASQYYERYRRPMMHAETNRLDARDAPRWLWRQWHNVQLLRNAGVPLIGFTWYSLTDQIDWDIALSRPLGNVSPVGLVDLNRDLRPVGLAYKHLIEMHRDQPGIRECRALIDMLDHETHEQVS